MGCFGNLAISQALPQMGAIYDSYTVANLSSDLRQQKVQDPATQKDVPVIIRGEKSWVPAAVAAHIFPAGFEKLNPQARDLIKNNKNMTAQYQQIIHAETEGARFAFRWVAVLPCILVVIFGSIALLDKLRGGYKAVHINH
jgi:hypothetical protein